VSGLEHSPKLWAIQFSNGWRSTSLPDPAADAREHGLPVVEYVPAEQLRAAVEERDRLHDALEDAVQLNPGWRARAIKRIDAVFGGTDD
jgi:hypothetical protein